MKNLFVGNLNFQTTETELRTLFEPFGQVTRAHIATDRETGRSRGFAFVEMPNDEEAGRAMTALDGKLVEGRSLKVNEARPRPPRSSAPRFSGNRGGHSGHGGHGGHSGRGGYGQEEFRDMPLGRREPRW